jgi:hypothetical protein
VKPLPTTVTTYPGLLLVGEMVMDGSMVKVGPEVTAPSSPSTTWTTPLLLPLAPATKAALIVPVELIAAQPTAVPLT